MHHNDTKDFIVAKKQGKDQPMERKLQSILRPNYQILGLTGDLLSWFLRLFFESVIPAFANPTFKKCELGFRVWIL